MIQTGYTVGRVCEFGRFTADILGTFVYHTFKTQQSTKAALARNVLHHFYELIVL